jgi:hypothetical protein
VLGRRGEALSLIVRKSSNEGRKSCFRIGPGPFLQEVALKDDLRFVPDLSKIDHGEHLTSLWFALRDASQDAIEARLEKAVSQSDSSGEQVIQEILRYRKGEISEVDAIRNIYDLVKEFVGLES